MEMKGQQHYIWQKEVLHDLQSGYGADKVMKLDLGYWLYMKSGLTIDYSKLGLDSEYIDLNVGLSVAHVNYGAKLCLSMAMV